LCHFGLRRQGSRRIWGVGDADGVHHDLVNRFDIGTAFAGHRRFHGPFYVIFEFGTAGVGFRLA
jgi:hypothetical protein